MRDRLALSNKHVLRISPTNPFNFDSTVHKPDHFPTADNSWKPGVRWQTMLWRQIPLGLKIKALGTLDKPKISITVWASDVLDREFLNSLRNEIVWRYNLRLNLVEFNKRFRQDPQFGPAFRRWRGMRPMSYTSLYEGLIITIMLQNATVRRSVQMLQSLFEKYGTLLCFDNMKLYCYWTPTMMANVPEQELRRLRVGYRARYIKRVSEAFARGDIDEYQLRKRSRDEQREALLGLYGVGPASVGYVLFDVFHHLDELNHISPWEQRIYSKLFFGVRPEEPVPVDKLLKHLKDRFGKERMLAVHYIWEDLFWRMKHQKVAWLEKLIRL